MMLKIMFRRKNNYFVQEGIIEESKLDDFKKSHTVLKILNKFPAEMLEQSAEEQNKILES